MGSPRDASTAIFWFTRDLRVGDHPALAAALDGHERVVPAFCLDPRLLEGRHASGPRTQFLLESLRDLGRALRERGSGLVIRQGSPEEELVDLARQVGASQVHMSADVTPYSGRRGRVVGQALRSAGVTLSSHPGLNAVDEVSEVRTKAGRPYKVFSPFHRSWLGVERRRVLAPPDELPPLPSRLARGRIPSLRSLGLSQEVADPARGGESAAQATLGRFLDGGVQRYEETRDALGADRTSRLSPDLHLGCLSPRAVEDALPRGAGAAAFRRQLCWRDFHHHVLAHFPQNAHVEFADRFRGRISWSDDRERFDAWRDGRTGYPLVDAGMRQLRREGWMHNRARLVVGSFLTKDLGIDWRWGERHFMRLLIDGDEANNNGNWQWIASVGSDPQPAFRRIYNPARHQERYDPRGDYVRRYVPELRDVPDEYIREPWSMPADVQRRVGCMVGRDYPEPIVEHARARAEALERYRT
jgi:deoxyribodipyrimidine photo-lyase